jgi:predicted Zn-dependent protease
MKRFQWTVIAAAAAALLATTVAHAFVASEKEVKRQARLQWLQQKRHLPLEPDPRVQAYVACVANRVIAELPAEEREAFDWEVVVFDEDQVNAMVDPNGKISVFNGILRVADTQDALAAVIGHEITHATLGHTMDRMKRAARQDVWSMIGAAATGVQVREYLHIALALPFYREQEIESDVVGLRHMSKAGFDPRSAIYFWKGMIAYNESRGRDAPPEFLSTHPPDQIRIDALIKNLSPALVNYNAAQEAGKRPNCTISR